MLERDILPYTIVLSCSIPKDTSPDLKDLLLRMLKRNAKDRIEFGRFQLENYEHNIF